MSAISKLFGEYEAVVKGLMMGIYIWVFAQVSGLGVEREFVCW